MKTIIHLFDRLGHAKFFRGTLRYQLDENCSVAFRVTGFSPRGETAVAVLMRDRRVTKGMTAALFCEWSKDDLFSPFAFILPQQGVNMNLYRTDRRGRAVGLRPEFRSRLEEMAANWDNEIMDAIMLRRCESKPLREIVPL